MADEEEFLTILVVCDDGHPRHEVVEFFRSTLQPPWHLTHVLIGGERASKVDRMSQNHHSPSTGTAERFRIRCSSCHGTFTARNDHKLWDQLQRLYDNRFREVRLTELHTVMRLANAVH